MLTYIDDRYVTTERPVRFLARRFATFHFYQQFLRNVWRSAAEAKRGGYTDERWATTSLEVIRSLESVGARLDISGIGHVRQLTTPCVFVGNHMSTLETIILPAIIQPIRDVTFVVKQSLIDYPVFRHILRSRSPIAVTRRLPREDFKTVMTQGIERLQRGMSVVVFPQTTRSETFDPRQFNTIGVKLAARAGVPVLPLALKTDAWGNGRRLKDFGPIDPDKTVHFGFGPPLAITGRGDQQHDDVIAFIESSLAQWRIDDSAGRPH